VQGDYQTINALKSRIALKNKVKDKRRYAPNSYGGEVINEPTVSEEQNYMYKPLKFATDCNSYEVLTMMF